MADSARGRDRHLLHEIFPSYYETYKWGLYNELVVLDLIEALESEGFPAQAQWLRGEWEKKTKYFVYDDRYPFRSEYAFDRTAFESSYALAKYGATQDMKAVSLTKTGNWDYPWRAELKMSPSPTKIELVLFRGQAP